MAGEPRVMSAATPFTIVLHPADGATAALVRAWVDGTGFALARARGLEAASTHDAVLCVTRSRAHLAALSRRPELPQLAFASALVVLAAATDAGLEDELLLMGVQAVVAGALPAAGGELARQLRHAVLRKRVERAARTAYGTDLATGLPHEAQLLEHMAQLVALREREPAPMVLIALRVEDYEQAAARLGGEAANVLRRKVAVRLRSALRASDVVAAIGPQMFGVLLAHLEARADGERVAAKLARSMQQPIVIAGQPCAVAVSMGLAVHPDHGKDAATLLRRAVAQAGGLSTSGAAPVRRSGSGRRGAANDEGA